MCVIIYSWFGCPYMRLCLSILLWSFWGFSIFSYSLIEHSLLCWVGRTWALLSCVHWDAEITEEGLWEDLVFTLKYKPWGDRYPEGDGIWALGVLFLGFHWVLWWTLLGCWWALPGGTSLGGVPWGFRCLQSWGQCCRIVLEGEMPPCAFPALLISWLFLDFTQSATSWRPLFLVLKSSHHNVSPLFLSLFWPVLSSCHRWFSSPWTSPVNCLQFSSQLQKWCPKPKQDLSRSSTRASWRQRIPYLVSVVSEGWISSWASLPHSELSPSLVLSSASDVPMIW